MVGRVPLCVHGAGETKTGSVSSPGAEEGWALFVQLLGGNHTQAPCHLSHSCSQGAALKTRRPTGLEGWPQPVKPWIPPSPAWKGRKGVCRRKGPKRWGQFSHLRAPLPNPCASPYTCLCFPHLQKGSLATLSKGTLSPLVPPPPSPLLPYFLRVRKVRWALERSQVWGWYDLFSQVSNQCICVSASSPCHHHPESSIGSRLEARDKAGLLCPFLLHPSSRSRRLAFRKALQEQA